MRTRRVVGVIIGLILMAIAAYPALKDNAATNQPAPQTTAIVSSQAITALNTLAVKGRAPMTGYTRQQYGDGWATKNGCSTRDIILHRDLVNATVNDKCQVTSGILHDPYTGKTIDFKRGAETSSAVQIDHIVAVGDAWQTGAQQLTKTQRIELYNDPLELLAVDGPSNEQKGDGDAATWLPSNKSFRCDYVARQIAVKKKYTLWVTSAEKAAMIGILNSCPGEALPTK